MEETIADAIHTSNSNCAFSICYHGGSVMSMEETEIRKIRLAEIVDKSKSVAEFARTYDLDVTYVRQLLSGYRAIGEKSARNLEEKLNLPRFALDKMDIDSGLLGPSIKTPQRPVRSINNPDEAEHDIISVPRFTLRASAGAGEPVLDVDEHGEPNYARRSWAIRRHLNPDNLFSIVSVGSSMEPEIHDGDSLIVHRQTNIENGKLMVICFRGECYVKRVLCQFDGSLIIRSTNSADYKDVIIDPDQLEDLQVVGRVVSITHNA